MTKRNVLWIMADQMNADCMSGAGHPNVRTPRLDALAATGIRFDQAYAQYPQCTPSRICFLRSQYCRTHRQYGFRGTIPDNAPQMLGYFHDHGWRTGAFGKLHVSPFGPRFRPDVCNAGYHDDYFMGDALGESYLTYLKRHGLSFPTHEVAGGRLGQHGPQTEPYVADVPLEHNCEKWTADRTIDFIRDSTTRGQPFFAWMSFERPHKPLSVPREMAGRVQPESIRLARPETAEQLLRKPRVTLLGRYDPVSDTRKTPREFRRLLAAYFTIIEMIDDQVGRVLEELRRLGVDGETHVVFCADHGDAAGVKRIFDKCLHASSNQINRIPLVFAPARGCLESSQAGKVERRPVESIDLFPTLCELEGLPVPVTAEGRSFAGVFRGEALDAGRAVFTESYYRRAVVKNGWKLVHHLGCGMHELYHLVADPDEYDNLYQVPGHAGVIAELKHELVRFLSEPFTEADTRWTDEVILRYPDQFWTYYDSPLHRRGGEPDPSLLEGAGVQQLRWKHYDLFYRIDTQQHLLFDWMRDPARQRNLYRTPDGDPVFCEMRDVLLDTLCRRIPPRTVWEPMPVGNEAPSPEEVERYLAQPLFAD